MSLMSSAAINYKRKTIDKYFIMFHLFIEIRALRSYNRYDYHWIEKPLLLPFWRKEVQRKEKPHSKQLNYVLNKKKTAICQWLMCAVGFSLLLVLLCVCVCFSFFLLLLLFLSIILFCNFQFVIVSFSSHFCVSKLFILTLFHLIWMMAGQQTYILYTLYILFVVIVVVFGRSSPSIPIITRQVFSSL